MRYYTMNQHQSAPRLQPANGVAAVLLLRQNRQIYV
jgi:hypothetical protein